MNSGIPVLLTVRTGGRAEAADDAGGLPRAGQKPSPSALRNLRFAVLGGGNIGKNLLRLRGG